MKNALIIGALALTLAGCSSINPLSKTTQIEESDFKKDEFPSWYLEVHQDTDGIVYGVGTGLSDDMQFSLDKAMHEAKIVIADKLSAKTSYELKRFISDNSTGRNGSTIQKSQKVSKSSFKDIDVSHYTVMKKEIMKEDGEFRSYVLIKLDANNRNNVVVITPEDDAAAQAAMDNL
jgi:hypothetical protein